MTSPAKFTEDDRFQLGVISGKIDLILVQNAAQAAQTEARFAKVEADVATNCEDIQALKRDRSWLMGAAAAVGAAGAWVGSLLGLGGT